MALTATATGAIVAVVITAISGGVVADAANTSFVLQASTLLLSVLLLEIRPLSVVLSSEN